MILIAHVIIALSSVAFASYLLVKPSQAKFYVNYGLIAATLVSGTYLVISTSSHLLSACASGLAYLAVTVSLSILAQRKFASQQ